MRVTRVRPRRGRTRGASRASGTGGLGRCRGGGGPRERRAGGTQGARMDAAPVPRERVSVEAGEPAPRGAPTRDQTRVLTRVGARDTVPVPEPLRADRATRGPRAEAQAGVVGGVWETRRRRRGRGRGLEAGRGRGAGERGSPRG